MCQSQLRRPQPANSGWREEGAGASALPRKPDIGTTMSALSLNTSADGPKAVVRGHAGGYPLVTPGRQKSVDGLLSHRFSIARNPGRGVQE